MSDKNQNQFTISKLINHHLRSDMEGIRQRLESHIQHIEQEISAIDKALEVEYTQWVIFLRRHIDGWDVVGIVDTNNPPEEFDENYDLVLPIPYPETLPEWSGI